MNLPELAKKAVKQINISSPIILTGLAVAGVVSTTILAVRATPAALATIAEFERRLNQEVEGTDEAAWLEATLVDKVKLTWGLYLPATLSGVITIGSVIGAQSINARRQAVLASGFTLAERALTEYQEKVMAIDDGKTDTKVRDAIAEDHFKANPPSNDVVLVDGNVLCYDDFSGRYFQSSMEKIRQAANDVNQAMIGGDSYASLNDFYMSLNLRPTKVGEQVGWSTENFIDVNFTSLLSDEGVPCLVVGFRAKPLQDYYKFH